MDIILHSTGCPKCKVLIKKLDEGKINYRINNDTNLMKELGISNLPVLEIKENNDDKLLTFVEAVGYINKVKGVC